MKRDEVTVERLKEMGYKGYMCFPAVSFCHNDDKTKVCNRVLDDIVYAVRTGGELYFTNDDVRGEVTVCVKNEYVSNGTYTYIRRKMTPAELLDADLRLAAMGVSVERK